VRFADGNGGVILNLSRSGIAMQAARTLGDESSLQMRFQLSMSKSWIEARGLVKWIDDSKKQIGVEFVDVPYEGRILINRWITWTSQGNRVAGTISFLPHAAAINDTTRTFEPSGIDLPPVVTADTANGIPLLDSDEGEPIVFTLSSEGSETAEKSSSIERLDQAPAMNASHPATLSLFQSSLESSRAAGLKNKIIPSRHIIGMAIAVLLFPILYFLFLFHTRTEGNGFPTGQVSASAEKSVLPPAQTNSTTVRGASLGEPGFVLQVAAMKNQENSLALIESLRRMNYPVIVRHRESDHFYYVLVGPFSDADSVAEVKKELKIQGFDAVQMPWDPAQK
jgi:SPOR domain/PilZ domain